MSRTEARTNDGAMSGLYRQRSRMRREKCQGEIRNPNPKTRAGKARNPNPRNPNQIRSPNDEIRNEDRSVRNFDGLLRLLRSLSPSRHGFSSGFVIRI